MRKIAALCLLTVALLINAFDASAQVSNITVRVQWNPNAASENVTAYTLTVDGGGPITILPAACTPTVCEHALTVSFAPHIFSLTATNSWGTSPATVVNGDFSLPGAPTNLRIVR